MAFGVFQPEADVSAQAISCTETVAVTDLTSKLGGVLLLGNAGAKVIYVRFAATATATTGMAIPIYGQMLIAKPDGPNGNRLAAICGAGETSTLTVMGGRMI